MELSALRGGNIPSLIPALTAHLLSKYGLSPYQVPGTVLTFTGYTAENNKDSVLTLIELLFEWKGEADYNPVCKMSGRDKQRTITGGDGVLFHPTRTEKPL